MEERLFNAAEAPSNTASGNKVQQHEATVLYPGSAKGRPTIELRVSPDGSNEAFLVPQAAPPVPTGVTLQEKNGKYFIYSRIRKKLLAFKAEEVVHQQMINWLIDDLSYPKPTSASRWA